MRDWAARLVPDGAEPAIGPATSGPTRWLHPGCALLQSGLPWASRAHSPCGLDPGAGEPSVSVLFVLLITLAVGYLVYRIIADGFRRPQSERLGCYGVFGYFVLIILGMWLATTVASRFF
jgi:hypothetical protein